MYAFGVSGELRRSLLIISFANVDAALVARPVESGITSPAAASSTDDPAEIISPSLSLTMVPVIPAVLSREYTSAAMPLISTPSGVTATVVSASSRLLVGLNDLFAKIMVPAGIVFRAPSMLFSNLNSI